MGLTIIFTSSHTPDLASLMFVLLWTSLEVPFVSVTSPTLMLSCQHVDVIDSIELIAVDSLRVCDSCTLSST